MNATAVSGAGAGKVRGSTDPSVTQLLKDSNLVASYGMRAGLFGQGATLFEAIRAASAKGEKLDRTSPETVELEKELGTAIKVIYPVSLPDLQAGWRADGKPYVGNSIRKYVAVIITGFLIYVCATLTVWQQRATALVNDMAVDKRAQLDAVMDDILILFGSGDPGELADAASPLREKLREKQRDIRTVQRSIENDTLTYVSLEDGGSPIAPLASIIRNALPPWAANAQNAAAPPGPVMVSTKVSATPSGMLRNASSDDAGCDLVDMRLRVLRAGAGLAKPEDPNLVLAVNRLLNAFDFDEAVKQRIYCDVAAPTVSGAAISTMARPESSFKERLEILALWWLPALYGALGAMVFHLRECLTPRPDPTTMKLVVRVGLSAFAGIAIGWFWMPSDGSALGLPEVTLTPLTIAFLVGFGIDVFVALLDRIVLAANRLINGLGATPAQS